MTTPPTSAFLRAIIPDIQPEERIVMRSLTAQGGRVHQTWAR